MLRALPVHHGALPNDGWSWMYSMTHGHHGDIAEESGASYLRSDRLACKTC